MSETPLSSNCYIINEWLLHDLLGDNGVGAQEESLRFLRKLIEVCDHIAIKFNSPWVEKAYCLMKRSDPPLRRISVLLHLGILLDSNKCLLINDEDIKEIPKDLAKSIQEKDWYLIESYITAQAVALITTDEKLYKAVSDYQGANIDVIMRNEFLLEYLVK